MNTDPSPIASYRFHVEGDAINAHVCSHRVLDDSESEDAIQIAVAAASLIAGRNVRIERHKIIGPKRFKVKCVHEREALQELR